MFRLMWVANLTNTSVAVMSSVIQKGCYRFIISIPVCQFMRHVVSFDESQIPLVNEELISWTKKISAYSRGGNLCLARKVFDNLPCRDSVSCNIMIRECIRHGKVFEARMLFDEIPERSTVSWNSMIMAYVREGKSHMALKLFIVMPDELKDSFSWTTVITGIAQDSCVADSWWLFEQLPEPDSAAWSAIISAFQRNGFASESLMIFKDMLSVGTRPNAHTVTSVLAAAADVAAISNGCQLYCQVLKRGFHDNTLVANSGISMFIKSGSLDCAVVCFSSISHPDLSTWNTMISGYGQHGCAQEASLAFHQMQKVGFCPDRISFLGVLQGCSYCGLVKDGVKYFESMQKEFRIPQDREHYVCMVDILARAGLLKEAASIIFKMPFEPTAIFWRTLLNGCRTFRAFNLGMYAADRVLELEPSNGSACLMIMEMYNAVGRSVEVAQLRQRMNEQNARKELSFSWIEIKGKVHLFTTRDESHHETEDIHVVLELVANATC